MTTEEESVQNPLSPDFEFGAEDTSPVDLDKPLDEYEASDFFPNSPKRLCSLADPLELEDGTNLNDDTEDANDTIINDAGNHDQQHQSGELLHIADTPTDDDDATNYPAALMVEKTVEKLKITVPLSSPAYYSSSSESGSSTASLKSKNNKKSRKYCIKCDVRFRKTSEFLRHLKKHIEQPTVQLFALDERHDHAYSAYLERQRNGCISVRTDLNGGGLKLKLKLSSDQNFEVVPSPPPSAAIAHHQQHQPRLHVQLQDKNIVGAAPSRILTASEIKLSPTHSRETPLDAMVALAEMTFNNDHDQPSFMTAASTVESEKVHFECPTLDGLDQFNEEVNKEAAAQLLKQLLENPQTPTENEWAPSNEYISIDRLAHICTVCHSNFPDAVMLYEHKRITGHDFQNTFQHQQQRQQLPRHPMSMQQQQQQHHLQQQQQQHRMQFLRPRSQAQMSGPVPPPAYGQPPVAAINQMQHQIRNFTMHQQGRFAGPLRPPFGQHGAMQPRRTPPPLYRVANGQAIPNQPLNMAPFMSMSPDMYNPVPGANVINGGNGAGGGGGGVSAPPNVQQRVSPSAQQRPSPMQRISPMQQHQMFQQQQQQQQQQQHHHHHQQQLIQQQQQQQQQHGMMRSPMMRQMRPIVGPSGQPQVAIRSPMYSQIKRPANYAQMRGPNQTPSPPTIVRARTVMPPVKKIKLEETDPDDCQVISMQPHGDGLPVIHSVQGASLNGAHSASNSPALDSTIQLSDQITLSVKGKDQAAQGKNPKDVANILAHRGITVTPTAKGATAETGGKGSRPPSNSNDDGSMHKASTGSTEEAVQKIQLNSSVSIISKKKTATTIDLSADDDKDDMPPPPRPFILCPVKDCPQRFLTREGLNRHTQRGHKSTNIRVHQCRLCPAKFATPEGLMFHHRKVHRISNMKTTADELGLPVVDMRNEQTRAKLAALGIVNYIPLGNLNKTTGGAFGLPIVSVQGAANAAVCNLAALGADSLLSLGPVKQIPRSNTM